MHASSYLSMGGEDIHVLMPTVQSLSGTQSVRKTAEASGEFHETEQSHLPTDLPVIRELGVNGEPEEVHTDAHLGVRFYRLPSVPSNNEAFNSHREIKKNPTDCQVYIYRTKNPCQCGKYIARLWARLHLP